MEKLQRKVPEGGRTGLFGGTFNPIHNGHLRAAEEIRELLALEQVLFIPSNNPPLKRDTTVAQAHHRFEMARLAIAGNPAFALSDIECRTNEVSYTINTIKEIMNSTSGSELFFILGLDAFLEMPKWYKAEEILSGVALVVMSRPTVDKEKIWESPYIGAEDINGDSRQAISIKRLKNGKSITIAEITPINISSTKIRQLRGEGRTIKYLLPENVESYIINHELYK
ncbi:MAG: nicotinate-nucleotide adenylyltransferase [Nitrospirae bacterium]|nr:nicotinate-nucleotide adenylyltransferase [Nitrospirota bacterium]